MISGPRNISTALMYSFAQRPDTFVFDEPFYAVYLSKVDVPHPGKDEVLAAQSSDEYVVSAEILNTTKPVVFIKNMAHHVEVLDKKFLERVQNIFLIRNPHQIIASYAEVIKAPVMRDIGIQYQYELFTSLKQSGRNPIVVDSNQILANPTEVLGELCWKIGIPFMNEMLSWNAGPKPYDGVWAPYWYENVHRSTGFEKQSTSSRELPSALRPLYEQAAGYYEELLKFTLSAKTY